MKEHKENLVMAVIMLIISLIILVMCQTITAILVTEEVGPRFVPTIVSGIMCILSAIWIVLSWRSIRRERTKGEPQEDKEREKINFGQLLMSKYAHYLFWMIFLLSILLIQYVGFIVSAGIIMFASMYLMCPEDEIRIPLFAALSIISPIILYFVFVKFFKLMLPVGSLWTNFF